MTSTYQPALHKFAVFVMIWTILLLVAGALVTSKEAALSVPDWPLSFGTINPPMEGGVKFEHSHRVIAGILGLFSIILTAWIWRKEPRRWLRWFSLTAVLGIVGQGVLGGLVVLKLLQYGLPVMHACLAQIVFAALLSIALFTSRWWVSDQPQIEDRGSPSVRSLAIANAVVIYLQVILGAGFRHRDIPIWPHIVGAFVVIGMVVWTAVVLRKRFESSREISKVRVLLHAIMGAQVLLGFGAYWSRLTTANAPEPMPIMVTLTVIHTVVGALLFGAAVWLVLLCYRLVPDRSQLPAANPRAVAAR
jgi:cytochrome c oxidase assembly protein subunit 15